MIHNVENPADISYVSVCSSPNRENEVIDSEDTRLRHYCNCLEGAVLVCEALTALTLALCAFVI